MADNYLERKMEEYRRGGAPGYRTRVTPTGVRAGSVVFPFPVRRMLVVFAAGTLPSPHCGAVALRDALVRAMAATGSKVAFTEDNIVERNRLAQSCGACGVAPGDTAVVSARWEGIDSVIGIGVDGTELYVDVNVESGAPGVRVRISPGGADTETAVRVVLWCLVPGNRYLFGSTIDI